MGPPRRRTRPGRETRGSFRLLKGRAHRGGAVKKVGKKAADKACAANRRHGHALEEQESS